VRKSIPGWSRKYWNDFLSGCELATQLAWRTE